MIRYWLKLITVIYTWNCIFYLHIKMLKTIDFSRFPEKRAWNFGNPILQNRNPDSTLFFYGSGILFREFWQLCIECIISYGVDTIVEHTSLIGFFYAINAMFKPDTISLSSSISVFLSHLSVSTG